MSALRIRLFGCPGISVDGAAWLRQHTRPAEALLGYLALFGKRMHPREKLAAVLWGDASEAHARGALRTTLWRLRERLEPSGIPRGTYLSASRAGEIGLNWDSGLWCDACAFEEALQNGYFTEARLEQAIDIYQGELLEGFYADWIIVERERLHALFGQALEALMWQASAAGDLAGAARYGQRLLADDPLRESVHRELIRCHVRQGRRGQALHQYHQCAETLKRELGVEPMEETRALYPQILDGEPACAALDAGTSREIAAAMRTVEEAIKQLTEARAHLAHRIQMARSPQEPRSS